MKKILYLFFPLLTALCCSCAKPDVEYVKIEEMYFNQAVPTFVDEGQEVNLSSYLMILPVTVADTVSVTWNSSNEEIATVNANGRVQALREGNVTITANAQDKFASLTLRIDKVKITEFTIPAKFEVYVGSKAKFPITDVSPKGTPLYRFKWEADNDGKKPTYSEGNWYLKADEEREYTLTASVDDAEDAKCQVKFVKPSVNTLAFNPASATVEEGSSLSLVSSLQVNPTEGVDADTIKVIWSSSKESVATIDQNGKVQAIAAGKATITAKAGGKTATCTVTVTAKPGTETPDTPIDPSDPEKPEDPDVPVKPSNANGHAFVDLGLSVKWATMNVGANSPEDPGRFISWGWTSDSYYSGTDKTLPLEYDVAHEAFGGDWRMPTIEEIKELKDNCSWTWITKDRVTVGYEVKSKINGNSIFLLAAGIVDDLVHSEPCGYYWSSSISTFGQSSYAQGLKFTSGATETLNISSDHGLTIRPVLP
ncbi:MAG: Ig-like domain-containing protein [Paludibacteraceae bacterium]|nr:Ig-like domain-containing protein [Paludibacteraceae bacterium]